MIVKIKESLIQEGVVDYIKNNKKTTAGLAALAAGGTYLAMSGEDAPEIVNGQPVENTQTVGDVVTGAAKIMGAGGLALAGSVAAAQGVKAGGITAWDNRAKIAAGAKSGIIAGAGNIKQGARDLKSWQLKEVRKERDATNAIKNSGTVPFDSSNRQKRSPIFTEPTRKDSPPTKTAVAVSKLPVKKTAMTNNTTYKKKK